MPGRDGTGPTGSRLRYRDMQREFRLQRNRRTDNPVAGQRSGRRMRRGCLQRNSTGNAYGKNSKRR